MRVQQPPHFFGDHSAAGRVGQHAADRQDRRHRAGSARDRFATRVARLARIFDHPYFAAEVDRGRSATRYVHRPNRDPQVHTDVAVEAVGPLQRRRRKADNQSRLRQPEGAAVVHRVQLVRLIQDDDPVADEEVRALVPESVDDDDDHVVRERAGRGCGGFTARRSRRGLPLVFVAVQRATQARIALA